MGTTTKKATSEFRVLPFDDPEDTKELQNWLQLECTPWIEYISTISEETHAVRLTTVMMDLCDLGIEVDAASGRYESTVPNINGNKVLEEGLAVLNSKIGADWPTRLAAAKKQKPHTSET
jgi:hypothetical protein